MMIVFSALFKSSNRFVCVHPSVGRLMKSAVSREHNAVPAMLFMKPPLITSSRPMWTFSYRMKRKRNVVKVIFPKSGIPRVLETKPSCQVMKKLNWENEVLFGKLIMPKSTGRALSLKEHGQVTNSEFYSVLGQLENIFPTLQRRELAAYMKYFHMRLFESSLDDEELNTGSSHDDEYIPLFTDTDSQNLLNFPISNDWRTDDASDSLELDVPISDANSDQTGNASYPSVTKILQATMPEDAAEVLKKWKERMITQLGEQGFQEYRQRLFSQGSKFHSCLQNYLKSPVSEGVEISVPQEVGGFWKSVKTVLPDINSVICTESPVCHPFLHYKGVIDCVAHYKGTPSLIEWKTSQRQKTTLKDLFDSPLQVAAYVGALNFDRQYNLQISQAVIVVAYKDGHPSHVHVLGKSQLSAIWKKWLERLSHYRETMGKSKA